MTISDTSAHNPQILCACFSSSGGRMDGGAADRIPTRAARRPELAVLDHRIDPPPRLLPRRHGSQPEPASPPIPDELLAEIFLRLPTPADLVRAYAACGTFRRVVAGRSFLREYRKLHAPPLLGFLDDRLAFLPAVAPHPSAPAASAVARTAGFSFSRWVLPYTASRWVIRDSRDGRVLLGSAPNRRGKEFFTEMVVCDPLHGRCLRLPPVPDDLAALVEHPAQTPRPRFCEIFLLPPGDNDDDDDDAVAAAEETSFRVIRMVHCATKPVAFLFSSCTLQWRAIPSESWSELFAGAPSVVYDRLFRSRHYVYGCFYWMATSKKEMKMLLLDTSRMEFSIAEYPPEARSSPFSDIAIAEAGEGRPGMFLFSRDTSEISFLVKKTIGGGSSQWTLEKTVSMDSSEYDFVGSMGRHLFLSHAGSLSIAAGYFSLNSETFQLQRVCDPKLNLFFPRAYCNFPPLLSTPTV